MTAKLEPALVSTIIPVFNRRELLQDSVNSVLRQSYRPIEIIIVDDGSDQEYANFYAALAAQHEEINVLTQTNQGPGAARETGRQHAKGDYIQYLDSDDLLLPHKFDWQVKALTNQPAAHASYGQCVECEIGNKPLDLNDYDYWSTLPKMRFTGSLQRSIFPVMLRERWWTTCSPLYRKSVLDRVGPWLNLSNEEDWEYDVRLASLGGELAYIPEVVGLRLLHNDHLSSGGHEEPHKLKDRCEARCKIYESARIFEKNHPESPFALSDWEHFSKYVFLLARQCAAAGLKAESKKLLELSIKAVGEKTLSHRVFLLVEKFLGNKGAARFFQKLGK